MMPFYLVVCFLCGNEGEKEIVVIQLFIWIKHSV